MDLESLRHYTLSFKAVTEGFPFDSDTLVFKVAGKMFLLVSLEAVPIRFNFKHDPELGLQYREEYSGVIEGYHMHKKHWSTVQLDGSIPSERLQAWVKDSYYLVISGMPKYKQKELKGDD